MNDKEQDHPPVTYHLVPDEVWSAQSSVSAYLPENYDSDGFIHCTDGEAEVIAVGNRYYTADPRDYAVLSISRDKLVARVKYEDPGRRYPHIYGPLNTDAVVEVRPVRRASDGTFVAIGV